MLQLLRHLRSSSASLKNPSTWFGSRSHGRISDCSMSGGSNLYPYRTEYENARESHSSLSFHDLDSRIKTRTMLIRGNFVYWHWRELPQPRTQCERNGRAHNFLRASSDFLPRSVISYLQTAFGRLIAGEQDSTLADLAPIIVREAVRHGGEAEYNVALHIFKNPPTPQHQLAAIAGLTAPTDSGLLMRTAGMCMQGEVPAESMPQVFHVRVIDTRDQQERLADVRSQ